MTASPMILETAAANLSPRQRYQRDLLKKDFETDDAQEQAVKHLQRLYVELIQRDLEFKDEGRLQRLYRKIFRISHNPIEGLYFWGGVGRGKTYLVNTFYDALPFEAKIRTHFHRFMQQVHQHLAELKDEKNPLERVADRISQQAIVICFDEFFVADIGDAMILSGLMQALFAKGITLVATSNIKPDELYKDGLQRERFTPAILLIQKHTKVINVDGGIDYRLRVLQKAELYHSPLDEAAERNLTQNFWALIPANAHVEENTSVEILGREIPVCFKSDDVVWFDFQALCDGPRSQNDYIEIGRIFHAVLISAVPVLQEDSNDAARRFINLIDEFYDRGVKVLISAAVAIPELYQGERLCFEFQRTQSRLLEMQSQEYLSREHRA